MVGGILPALILGGLSLGSSIVSAVSSNKNTEKALANQSAIQSQTARDLAEERAYNSSEAQKTRDWQERLANSSYQRAVQDMEKAGLNPYLAYNQGGAVTPSGATASHSGIANTSLSSSVGLTNTLLNNQTARDNATIYATGMALSSLLKFLVKK